MTNATEQKFGDPATRIAQTDHWTVLLRPKQPTLGSLVLVCREPVTAFGAVSPAGYADLGRVIRRVEALLQAEVGYQRINHLMLMMVDPDVHFHVIPRYEGTRTLEGHSLPDVGWPGPPALDAAVTLAPAARDLLLGRLRAAWLAAAD